MRIPYAQQKHFLRILRIKTGKKKQRRKKASQWDTHDQNFFIFLGKLSPYPHLSFGAVQSPQNLASFLFTSICPFTVFCLPHFCVWTFFCLSGLGIFPSAPRAAVSFLLTS
jgi:hypothetical protein